MTTILLHRATGYKPVDLEFVESLREMLTQAEKGEVTSFAWVAAGPDFATWTGRTKTTRQDCMLLLGQLQLLSHFLIEDEMLRRDNEND